MIETLCERLGVGLSVRTVERMLARFGGLPLTVHSLVRRAHLLGLALDTTEHVGTVYAQEIRDGMIHWYWRAQFSTQFPQAADRQVAAELCSYLASCYPERIPLAQLSNRLSLEPARLQEMVRQLQLMGVLDRSFGTVGLTDDPVMRDVVTVLAWGENSSTSDAELLRRLAARRVCGASTPPAEETNAECLDRLERFLQSFRGQYLPAEWFHYRDDFGAGWTGAEGIRRSLGSSETLVRLPFLMAVSRTDVASLRGESTGLRPIVFRGSGFRDRQLTPGNETQWLAVVWLTADPVGVEHVEETLRVKDEIARRTGREVSHVWLIGKATFSREARQRCAQSSLFTGNMAMIEYIHDQMSAPGSPYAESATPPPVPEMIGRPAAAAPEEPFAAETLLPADHFPERRAAEMIEQAAQAAGFSPARIGQIKLALLEVVIHAAETSVDPANRLLLRHRALADRLDVSLRYQGPSPPPLATEPPPESQSQAADKGLHLAYSLADQVTIRSDAGVTEIQLTFRREAQAADGGGRRQEANA
jgi:anti-sigma regulatory factor (Ser/Thr protein kinase)